MADTKNVLSLPDDIAKTASRQESLSDTLLHSVDKIVKYGEPVNPREGNGVRLTQETPMFNLPQELLDMIVPFVGTQDRLHLMRTCTKLYCTILPFLYETIFLRPVRIKCPGLLNEDFGEPQYTDEDSDYHIGKGEYYILDDTPLLKFLKEAISKRSELGALVKNLHLQGMKVISQVPNQILALTPNLTNLHYDYLVPMQLPNSSHKYRIDCHQLQSALHLVRATLKRLKITYTDPDDNIIFYRTSSFRNCSLKMLSSLEYVDIPFKILMGTDRKSALRFEDCLPSGLIHLNFVNDHYSDEGYWSDENIWDALVGFVEEEKWKEIVPRLTTFNCAIWKEIDCDGKQYDEESGEEFFIGEKEFKSLCSRNGLLCETFMLF